MPRKAFRSVLLLALSLSLFLLLTSCPRSTANLTGETGASPLTAAPAPLAPSPSSTSSGPTSASSAPAVAPADPAAALSATGEAASEQSTAPAQSSSATEPPLASAGTQKGNATGASPSGSVPQEKSPSSSDQKAAGTVARPPEPSRGAPRPALPTRVVLGYYVTDWAGDRASYNSLAAHADQINFVSPFWFSILRDGTIRLRGYDHSALQTLARQKGVKTLALVTNPGHHDAMLKDPQVRQTSIDNLLAWLEKYQLDGVNIDFEGAPPEDRDKLTAYMKALHEQLAPKGYYVTIAVVASASPSPNDEWAGIFDYQALAPYVDFMVLMTYDQHEESSPPGPVAAQNWVEARVKYILTQVPAAKVVLGLAGYGYDWSKKGVETVFARQAKELAATYGAEIKRDEQSGEANFTYVDAEGIQHRVWYEDSVSVAQKLRLVDKYGLRGVALWRLGQEEEAFWDALAQR